MRPYVDYYREEDQTWTVELIDKDGQVIEREQGLADRAAAYARAIELLREESDPDVV